MSDAVEVAAPAAEVVRLPDGAVDPIAAGKAAQAAVDAERAELDKGAAPQTTAAVDQAAEPEPASKERGPDGKFKPKADKAEAEPTKADKAAEPAKPLEVGSAAKLRRLWHEGKIAEALEGLTGQKLEDVSKLSLPSRAFVALREERKRAESYKAQADQAVASAVQRLEPLAKAAELRDKGDLVAAAEAFFGMPLLDFQKSLVGAMASPGKDPHVSAALKELHAERDAIRKEREEWTATQTKAQQDRAISEQRSALVGRLAESDNPIIARASEKRVFVETVIEKMREHWDGESTIPEAEAAELAFEELYGGVIDASQATGARSTPRQTVPGPTPARTAKAANLNRKSAAEAAPTQLPPPGSKELLEYHIRLAQSGLERERGTVA